MGLGKEAVVVAAAVAEAVALAVGGDARCDDQIDRFGDSSGADAAGSGMPNGPGRRPSRDEMTRASMTPPPSVRGTATVLPSASAA